MTDWLENAHDDDPEHGDLTAQSRIWSAVELPTPIPPLPLSPKEIDQKVREAHDTGYLEGVLLAKEANATALNRARLGTSVIGVVAVVLFSILVYVTLLSHS